MSKHIVSVEPHFDNTGNVDGTTITVIHGTGCALSNHQCIGVVYGLMPGDAGRLSYEAMGETIVKDCHGHDGH